jgi:hypothetical protein
MPSDDLAGLYGALLTILFHVIINQLNSQLQKKGCCKVTTHNRLLQSFSLALINDNDVVLVFKIKDSRHVSKQDPSIFTIAWYPLFSS